MDFKDELNEASLEVISGAKLEQSLDDTAIGDRFQFERTGYFIRDPDRADNDWPVFNRIVALRDGWAKLMKKTGGN